MHDLRHTKSTLDESRHFHSVRCSNSHQPSVSFAENRFSTDPRMCRFPTASRVCRYTTNSSWHSMMKSTMSVSSSALRAVTFIVELKESRTRVLQFSVVQGVEAFRTDGSDPPLQRQCWSWQRISLAASILTCLPADINRSFSQMFLSDVTTWLSCS